MTMLMVEETVKTVAMAAQVHKWQASSSVLSTWRSCWWLSSGHWTDIASMLEWRRVMVKEIIS